MRLIRDNEEPRVFQRRGEWYVRTDGSEQGPFPSRLDALSSLVGAVDADIGIKAAAVKVVSLAR